MMAKEMYSWWSKYMFWSEKYGFPFPAPQHLFIGHRGSSEHYPENTMLAYHKAVEEGAHGIEIDVQRTQDEVFVAMHDLTIDKTTEGSGPVSSHNWDYLSTLDAGGWKGPEFANRPDTKIPRIDDVLDAFKGLPVFLVLHVKVSGTQNRRDFLDLLSQKDMWDQIVIFSTGFIPFAKSYLGDVSPFAYMNDDRPMDSNYSGLLDRAIDEGWDVLSWRETTITEQMVQAVHKAGLRIHASYLTTDYSSEVERLIGLRVDWMLGNDCAQMVEAGNRLGVTQIVPRGKVLV